MDLEEKVDRLEEKYNNLDKSIVQLSTALNNNTKQVEKLTDYMEKQMSKGNDWIKQGGALLLGIVIAFICKAVGNYIGI